MVKNEYKPVAHDAAFKKKILAKPGVKKAYDALEEEYAALHTMLEARLAAGLTQADIAKRMGTTVSAVSRLEASLRKRKALPFVRHPQKICTSLWQKTIGTDGLRSYMF
jgi:ribosome-binding protein aMBF1 (putative translation factor)